MARVQILIHATTANGSKNACHKQCSFLENNGTDYFCLAFLMTMPIQPCGKIHRLDKCISAEKKAEKLVKKQGEF